MARTTLVIPDALWREVKQRAAKENVNISEWVSDAISVKIKPGGKSGPAQKYKFDESWFARPGGADLPYPMTREWIYGAATEDPQTWR